LPVEGRSEIDGSPKGVTFNSFILPGSDPPYLRGELNAWQVNDTTRYAEPPPWPWWHHFIGPIWEDHSHAQPQVSPWHVGPTAGHQGLVEMHPVDWVVRLQPRPLSLRKPGRWLACATFAGRTEEADASVCLLLAVLIWGGEAEDGVPGCFCDERFDRIACFGVEEGAGDRRLAQVTAQHRPGLGVVYLGYAEPFVLARSAEFDPACCARVLHPVSLSVWSHKPAFVAVFDERDRC
jgi:hypothetical protein